MSLKETFLQFSIIQGRKRIRLSLRIIHLKVKILKEVKNPKVILQDRKVLGTLLFSLVLGLILASFSIGATSSTSSNLQLAPLSIGGVDGSNVVPTSGSSAQFNVLVINQGNDVGSGEIEVNGMQSASVSVPPLSFKEVTLTLPVGEDVVSLDGQSFSVDVVHVSQAIQGTVYVNGSNGIELVSAKPGEYLSFNVTLTYNVPSGLMGNLTFVQSSGNLVTNAFVNGVEETTSFPSSSQSYEASETQFVAIPDYLSQGIYYFYGAFLLNYNGTLTGYVPYFVVVNVSYGLTGTLETPSFSSAGPNGSYVCVQNVSNGYLLLLKDVANQQDIVKVIEGTSSGNVSYTFENQTYYYTYNLQPDGASGIVYGNSKGLEFYMTSSFMEVYVPGSQVHGMWVYVQGPNFPNGITLTVVSPNVVPTSSTATSSTTSTTSATTTSSTSSTTATSPVTTLKSQTPTSTTSSSGLNITLLVVIVIVIIVVAIAAVFLLRR